MDDATISVLSAAVKRDEPPVGDKALAYTRGGPSLKDADNPEVVRTNFESVTRFLTEFAEYHAIHYPACVTHMVILVLLSRECYCGKINLKDLWRLFPVQQAAIEVCFPRSLRSRATSLQSCDGMVRENGKHSQ